MSEFVETSRGDRIAYDRYGDGPAVVFIAGAGIHRGIDPVTGPTAELLAERGLSAFVYDRLGRGESGAEGVLDLDRELASVAAMLEVAGGEAVLVGHSSGCSIALAAVDAGLPVHGLVLWEAPIADVAGDSVEWAEEFERLLDAGRLEDAQRWYMKDMPPEWLEAAASSPAWPQMYGAAGSMRSDAQSLRWAVTGDPAETFARVRVPVLALAGTSTFDEMVHSSQLIVDAIPGATQRRVAGADHSWEPGPMAEVLVEFVEAVVPA